MTGVIATRRFTAADQQAFAALSGDCNPIHTDPVAARRTLAGQCVVHGMHAVLWALGAAGVCPARLRIRFIKPMYVDEDLDLQQTENRLAITAAGTRLVDIQLEGTAAPAFGAPPETKTAAAPLALPFAECAGRAETLAPQWDSTVAARLLPAALATLGPARVAEMAALSAIVGMRCPGLQSLFSALDLTLAAAAPALRYACTQADDRFRLLTIETTGQTLHGTLSAFHRPPPVEQPQTQALAALVAPSAFAGQRALVIGGSRGLGEVTAKLLAAGGARVTITYAHSADDAARVADDIAAAGGACATLQYRIEQPAPLPAATHVYYFATPRIFGKRGTAFEPARLAAFTAAYVTGFAAVHAAMRAHAQPCAFFYPSSIAIAQPLAELAEYAAAKEAGESLCAKLEAEHGLPILIHRLPRTATDQTAALVESPSETAASVMLPLIHGLQNRLRAIETPGPAAAAR